MPTGASAGAPGYLLVGLVVPQRLGGPVGEREAMAVNYAKSRPGVSPANGCCPQFRGNDGSRVRAILIVVLTTRRAKAGHPLS